MIFLSLYIFLLFELAAVAWADLKYRKVPNLWSYLNFGLFLALTLSTSGIWSFSWMVFCWPLLIFIFGFLFFWLGIMGGGDAKYLASLFLVIPLRDQEPFMFALLIATIIASAVLILWNFYKESSSGKGFIVYIKENFGRKYPFIPVVFFSWAVYGAMELLVGRA